MARSDRHPWPPGTRDLDAWIWAWAIVPAVDERELDLLRRHHAAHEHIRRRRGMTTSEMNT